MQRRSVLIFPQDSDCAFANQITDPAPMKVQMELDPDDDERHARVMKGSKCRASRDSQVVELVFGSQKMAADKTAATLQ